MALTKSVPTRYGAPATYHHVCAVLWDKSNPETVQVQLACWLSKEARELLDGQCMDRLNFTFPREALADLSVQSAYEAIKATSAWSDAVDAI